MVTKWVGERIDNMDLLYTTGNYIQYLMKVKMNVAQLCPILRDHMDYTDRGILQARTLEWVAVSFSGGSFQPRDWTQVSCIVADSLPSEPPGKPISYDKPYDKP